MIKKHIKLLVITSVAILLPMLVGLILWNQLPDQIPSHWNVAGEVDGWSSKPLAVFGMPLLLLALQWICMFATSADPKKAHLTEKTLHLVLWLIPALSVVLQAITYTAALGNEVQIEVVIPVFMGLLFTIIGNYLPKCKQNYTIGIKIPWTLSSEENWNQTHRFTGWVWVVSGLIIMLSGFFGGFWIFLGIAPLMVLAPVIYSYLLYRKGV